LGSLLQNPLVQQVDSSSSVTFPTKNGQKRHQREGHCNDASVARSHSNIINSNGDRRGSRLGEDLREAAMRRGAKVLPCKARGQPMDHNIHVSCTIACTLCSPSCVLFLTVCLVFISSFDTRL
jgi:hypothetical protein